MSVGDAVGLGVGAGTGTADGISVGGLVGTAEGVQVVSYAPGQQYREHTDYFSPT